MSFSVSDTFSPRVSISINSSLSFKKFFKTFECFCRQLINVRAANVPSRYANIIKNKEPNMGAFTIR